MARDKEIKLFQIKLKEFQSGDKALNLNDRQFLELETLLAQNQLQNVFTRIAALNENGATDKQPRLTQSLSYTPKYNNIDIQHDMQNSPQLVQQPASATMPAQIQIGNPPNKVVSNTKPFLENIQKVQMNPGSNKAKNFIEANLGNVELTLKSVR